jgi:diguanylate cyclase (GGDEF)-like protein/putative nucleotidyltransferase with HDIG domain
VAAGIAFDLLGGIPGALDPAREWPALLAATAGFFTANTLLVAGAICLTERLPFLRTWKANFLWTAPAYLAGTFLASTLALGTQRYGAWALIVSLPLLYVLYFSLRVYFDRLRQDRAHGQQLAGLYLKVIEALALAIDAKDRTTQRHVRRVQTFAVELGHTLGLPPSDIEALKAGALLHDIGKLAVPEHVLCKPGRLTREEFDKMKIHPRVGAEILEAIDFPFPLTEVVRSHHEKWDGTGYPDRLKGEEIPLTARILAVVDCYDALTSDRPYRRPLSKDEALRFIRGESGASYDPRVVDALVVNLDRMESLAGDVNRTQETAAAPDKRLAGRDRPGAGRQGNLLRESILDHISSAHRELYALYEIAQGAARSLDLEEAMTFLSGKIARLIHHRCLVLYLADPERRQLIARFARGHDAARLLNHAIDPGTRMSGWAAVHRQPLLGRHDRDPVRREGVRSDLEEFLERDVIEPLDNALVAPLLDGDQVIGVLALYDRPDQPYEEDGLRLVSLVAKHVATAVKNSLAYGARRDSTLTDPLTSLPNARYLFVSFEEEIARATRQQVPLSLLEVDVNNFHVINDDHGHAAGDRILRSIARVIRAQMRGCDTCVRYAADEFVVILPGVGRQEVDRMRVRLEEAVRNHKFAVHGRKPVQVSISLGCASFPEDGRNFDALMAVADSRLHDAKAARSGRPPDRGGCQRFAGRRNVPVN